MTILAVIHTRASTPVMSHTRLYSVATQHHCRNLTASYFQAFLRNVSDLHNPSILFYQLTENQQI